VGPTPEPDVTLIGAGTPPAAVLAELPSWVGLVRAPNPGPMTLDGTNTWVLRAPGAKESVVVDPGPRHEGHLAAVAARGPVGVVLVTHSHPDHVEGLEGFLRLCPGARVFSARGDGDGFSRPDGLSVTVIQTPGHTADSTALVVALGDDRAVVTGDTILGRGTTVVAHPDGDLGDYLASLRRLRELGPIPALPGHGPPLADCAAAAGFYLRHRLARLEQVRAAWAAGARTAPAVVARVYADTDRALWPAAEMSVRAQLAYLASGSDLDRGSARELADAAEADPA
jgi:glyoxylase-like metal-dependent hydrolase (beta-lactamase superfamily II)